MIKILLIDDDDITRGMMAEILSREGHEVVSIPNGHQAIVQFEKCHFDLVITDLVMPGKEGLETIMDLRRHNRDIKIIAVSGGGRIGPNDYLSLARKFGAKLTLAKPFTRSELVEAVARVILE